jgi:acetyltransferase-like isoleucine patch superfamily enzyme
MNMKSSKLKSFRLDPTGNVAWSLDDKLLNLSMIGSTAFCYFQALLWKINLGAGCRFYGVTQFKRYPCSEISIGKQCGFRSSFRSNFIGLNHACGISTHSKKAKIKIGASCGFSGAIIGAYESITIADHVNVGANTVITDFDWHPISRQTKEMKSAPIVIDNEAWIGMNCTILKGVYIGKGSIIAANSVVTRSIPEMVIAAGSPARVIREIK